MNNETNMFDSIIQNLFNTKTDQDKPVKSLYKMISIFEAMFFFKVLLQIYTFQNILKSDSHKYLF